MDEKKTTVRGGVSFTGLLTIVFITLKLCGVINWPWLWVLSPLWISLIAGIVLITICVLILKAVD